MQSRTSAFNKTLFLKTVCRSWPVWAIYFGVWFLALPAAVNASQRYGSADIANTIFSTAGVGGTLICGVAAIASVMAAWSFMYSARAAGGMACLPVSRTGIFLSLSLAGLAPLLAVNVVIALLTAGVGAMYGAAAFGCAMQWLAVVTLELLYFYGFALLCAQLTGNGVILPIVYTVLNFTAYVVESLVRETLSDIVYGMSPGGQHLLDILSPPLRMASDIGSMPVTAYVEELEGYTVTGYTMHGFGLAAIYAAAGIVLAVCALALYKRRRMETAGDVVAIKPLRPVFKYCMTFGCALVLGWVIYFFCGEADGVGSTPVLLALMLVGAFVGYFVSEMLIKKSMHVFGPAWRGFGISAAVIIALMCSAEFDIFGYESRVPDIESVKSVYFFAAGESVTYYEPENIRLAEELHRSIVDGKSENLRIQAQSRNGTDDNSSIMRFNYELKNGAVVQREYSVFWKRGDDSTTALPMAAQELLNTAEGVTSRKATAFDFTEQNIFSSYIDTLVTADEGELLERSGRVGASGAYDDGAKPTDSAYYSVSLTPEEAYELYSTCILPDIADGTLGRIWLVTDESYYRTVCSATISIDARIPDKNSGDGYKYDYFYTTVTVDAVRTNQWLAEHGIPAHPLSDSE